MLRCRPLLEAAVSQARPHTPLMVLGTSSGAGKSLMTAALCRVLKRRGETPLPFKGQNMSNNAWVDPGGGEMAYSQALQAWAAGREPECAMNPVLLKPQGDSTSEVIHLGRSVGTCRAEHYYRDWFRPGWAAIRQGLHTLQDQHPEGRLVLEGAGSPVEVNLQARDLTNLRLAQYLRARCLLVADIERGGVFAQIVGTLALLQAVERPLIGGLLINRFRGRRELFDEGRRWLEQHSGIPVLGVMPWLDELFPPEDSLDLLERRGRKRGAELEIAVLKLPSLSNFSDLDPPGSRANGAAALGGTWRTPGNTRCSGDSRQQADPARSKPPAQQRTGQRRAALCPFRRCRLRRVRRHADARPGTGGSRGPGRPGSRWQQRRHGRPRTPAPAHTLRWREGSAPPAEQRALARTPTHAQRGGIRAPSRPHPSTRTLQPLCETHRLGGPTAETRAASPLAPISMAFSTTALAGAAG